MLCGDDGVLLKLRCFVVTTMFDDAARVYGSDDVLRILQCFCGGDDS